MRTYDSWNDVDLKTLRDDSNLTTFFVSRLADIPDRIPAKAQAKGNTKHILFSEGLPIEALPSRLPRLGIRDAHRLHIARESELRRIADLLSRLVRGITQPNGPRLIVDAWVEDRNLILLDPSFERLTVSFDKLKKYIGSNNTATRAFEIDEDGSFIYWPHTDTHLGWQQFMNIVDPTATLATDQRSQEFNRRYGAAIRAFREQSALKQTDVTGVTDRNLRRVEHGIIAASKTTLEALAKAHGLSLAAYLKELAKNVEPPPSAVDVP